MGQILYVLAFLALAAGLVLIAIGFQSRSGVEWAMYLQLGVSSIISAVLFAWLARALEILQDIASSTRHHGEITRFLALQAEKTAFPVDQLAAPLRVLRSLGDISGAARGVQKGAVITFVEGLLDVKLSDPQKEHILRIQATSLGNLEQDLQALRQMPPLMADHFRQTVLAVEARGKSKDAEHNAKLTEVAGQILAIVGAHAASDKPAGSTVAT